MTDRTMTFDPNTARVVAKPTATPTPSPITALLWLAFSVALLISPALIWAGWKWLL